ncbi:hypothetical protein [Mucilaginibacter sp. NFX135]|uniref:hypothetical protein n=1 Tax=Mucilaginibacter sp. NFX135 TaxID=3402687 RepID=UPI003AFB32E4
MINTWLQSTPSVPSHKLYGMISVVEIGPPSDNVKDYLGHEIISSYHNLDDLKGLYEHLPENRLRDYIKDYVLPSDAHQLTLNVRQGDFSEVLASLIVSYFEKRIVPLKKMRWKFNKDKSVFSTDMFAHNAGNEISDLYYYEIKSRLNTTYKEGKAPDRFYITVHAHNSLLKDMNQPNEGIADFLSKMYSYVKDYDSARKYHDIILNPTKYNRAYELFFIIETSKFNPAILDDLENLPPTLKPLCVTIVLIGNLARLMVDLQQRAVQQAVDYIHPAP